MIIVSQAIRISLKWRFFPTWKLKSAKNVVSAYYEVLCPISNKDLDRTDHEIAAALQALPPSGYVSTGQLKGRHGQDAARRALEWACANDILHKTIQDSAVMYMYPKIHPTPAQRCKPFLQSRLSPRAENRVKCL